MEIDKIIEEAFTELIPQLNPADITDDATMDSIEGWDSMTFLQIIMKIEDAIGSRFNPGEVARMFNVKNIKEIISEKI